MIYLKKYKLFETVNQELKALIILGKYDALVNYINLHEDEEIDYDFLLRTTVFENKYEMTTFLLTKYTIEKDSELLFVGILAYCRKVISWKLLKLVLEIDEDWNKKSKHFDVDIDFLMNECENNNISQKIITFFPEKYERYLKNKKARDFNL